MLGDDGGPYKTKIVLFWNAAPPHLKKLCYNAARNAEDVFVDDNLRPRPGQTSTFCITTPVACGDVLEKTIIGRWNKATGAKGMGRKQYSQY